MPTYAYACTDCGHRFDAVQSFSEPSLTECPQCQGRLRKEYGSIGVTFNGPGFYRTDSRGGAGADGKTKTKTGAGTGEAKKSADAGSASSSSSSSSSSTSSTTAAPATAGS